MGVRSLPAAALPCTDVLPHGQRSLGCASCASCVSALAVSHVPLLPLPLPPSPDTAATAPTALEQLGDLKPGKTVLVTAAAGGTGQFAVQLARLAGCHVVATCSSESKAQLLRNLGAARVINYKTDDVKAMLKRHYPQGVDLVYESVGGDMFDLAVNALATKGRVIVIGMMSQYGEGWPASEHRGLAEKLLWKSASVCGFFLLAYAHCYKRHLAQLAGLVQQGRLQVALDPRRFVGLGSVAEAVEHLHSGRSSGKVVVQIPQELPPLAGAKM